MLTAGCEIGGHPEVQVLQSAGLRLQVHVGNLAVSRPVRTERLWERRESARRQLVRGLAVKRNPILLETPEKSY